MDEYAIVKKGKLVLKGEKQKHKKRSHSKLSENKKTSKNREIEVDQDSISNGGWWRITQVLDIKGPVAIQFGKSSYVKALDNGLFTLGAPHRVGEGPAPEEIFTAFQINENKIAFKSGFDKYLKIEKDGTVTGRSNAVGAMEQWEPVFQDKKTALLADNGNFMSIDPEDDRCVALRKTVEEHEILTLRTSNTKEVEETDERNIEENSDLKQVELNYVKKFQKFQNKKIRISANDTKELDDAKTNGCFHEKLLDRRSTMKADRYCK